MNQIKPQSNIDFSRCWRKAMKRLTCIFILTLLLLSFTSCVFEKYNRAEHVEKNGVHGCVYQGNFYYLCEVNLDFYESASDSFELVLVSWSWTLPPYREYLYSNTANNPEFLSSVNGVYVREDYQYKKDVFYIEGTDDCFVFESAFIRSDFNFDGQLNLEYEVLEQITILSNTHNCSLDLEIVLYEGKLYGNSDGSVVFELSDELIEIINKYDLL